jgi:hypothetical protein
MLGRETVLDHGGNTVFRGLLLAIPLGAVLFGLTNTAYTAPATGSPAMGMGMTTTISRKAFEGYYDGHKDTYLNTDVSDKAEAAAMHINYAPALRKVPLVSTPVLITSDTQIDRLEKRGVLSERATSIRLNCPIVRVGKGS